MWTPRCFVFNAAGRRGNEVACGLHTASFSRPREGGKRGGMWFPRRLIVDAAERRGNDEAGSGLLPGPSCYLPRFPRCSSPRSLSLTTGCWVGWCRGSHRIGKWRGRGRWWRGAHIHQRWEGQSLGGSWHWRGRVLTWWDFEENTTCVLLFAELFGPPAKNKFSFLLPPIRGNDWLPANFLRLLGLSRGD